MVRDPLGNALVDRCSADIGKTRISASIINNQINIH